MEAAGRMVRVQTEYASVKYILVFVIALACAGCADDPQRPVKATISGTQSELDASCKLPVYQCLYQPVHISVILRDGSKFDTTLPPPTPIVQPGQLFIFPGQTLYLEADLDGDKLTNFKLVPSVVHPEKTLTLKFTQESGGAAGNMMMFNISNPFDRPMKYRAGLMHLDPADSRLFKTSACPVVAKGNAFETWSEPLFQLVMADFHLVDPKSQEAGMCD